jgi:hypothetical protein
MRAGHAVELVEFCFDFVVEVDGLTLFMKPI